MCECAFSIVQFLTSLNLVFTALLLGSQRCAHPWNPNIAQPLCAVPPGWVMRAVCRSWKEHGP